VILNELSITIILSISVRVEYAIINLNEDNAGYNDTVSSSKIVLTIQHNKIRDVRMCGLTKSALHASHGPSAEKLQMKCFERF
jgi:hypothetical protein